MFSYFAEKRRHKTSISEKRPRVPASHPSDYDSTWSHDTKSIKNHCGTSNAWLPQTSTRLRHNAKLHILRDSSATIRTRYYVTMLNYVRMTHF